MKVIEKVCGKWTLNFILVQNIEIPYTRALLEKPMWSLGRAKLLSLHKLIWKFLGKHSIELQSGEATSVYYA